MRVVMAGKRPMPNGQQNEIRTPIQGAANANEALSSDQLGKLLFATTSSVPRGCSRVKSGTSMTSHMTTPMIIIGVALMVIAYRRNEPSGNFATQPAVAPAR